MIKVLINNEEVVSNHNLQIKEEMLSTSSTILKNCYPKVWENDKDYVSRYYYPKDYSKCKIYNLPRENTTQEQTGTNLNFETYIGKSTLEDIKFYGDTLQNGTPTPSSPVEIQSVTGLQNINVCGKNLFKPIPKSNGDYGIKATYNEKTGLCSLSGTGTETWSNPFSDFGISLPQGKYTFSLNKRLSPLNVKMRFLHTDSTYTDIIINNNETVLNKTAQINKETRAIRFWFGGTLGSTVDFKDLEVQLEQNSTATTYEPYKGNTYEVNLGNIELNKIGTYQDRIYKDNGKWYVEKQIGKVVLDGSENWSYTSGARERFTTSINDIALQPFNSSASIVAISNYFLGTTWYNLYNNTSLNNALSSHNSIHRLNIRATQFNGSTSDFKTWLGTNKPEVIYALATPTYTEITNTELINQLESLNIQLYEGQTNFIIDGNLPMPTYIKIYTNFEELIFCGFTKNTGNVSLNPRQFHGVDLQILDFKDLLSTGETLNYVIANKTITEAINQVVNSISDYGFVVGNIQLLNPNEMIGAYSTLNKTAYDVFQYFADITQSRWTTRMVDENTIAIDFYDPTLMPQGTQIQSTTEFYENNDIVDISFNYSTNDYRNKQIMTSDEIYANITQTETIIADGYATSFMCQNKIGLITNITLNGVEQSFITKNEEQLGYSGDFIYQPGENTFISTSTISAGGIIVITYYPIVKGREIILNSNESGRIETQIGRKGIISRYENRNDSTSSQELQKIGQSYIKYKGKAEITLKIVSTKDIWNIGQIVNYNAPLEELTTDYMVKSKSIDMYLNAGKIFYTYELTSNFNYENAVNYFDNQRAKNQGNIGEGETITRNIDLESTALIKFYDTIIEETQVQNPTSLDFALDGVLI